MLIPGYSYLRVNSIFTAEFPQGLRNRKRPLRATGSHTQKMALNGGPDALNGSHKICESHNCTPKNFRGFAATSQQNWCGGDFQIYF